MNVARSQTVNQPRIRLGVRSENPNVLHIRAGILYLLLFVAARIAAEYEIGWVMLLPTLMLIVILTKWSPPVSVSTLLFGSVLFSGMDLTVGFLPRIPAISTITVWMILWLIVWQSSDGSWKRLNQPVVIKPFIAFLAFFGIGLAGAFMSDTHSSGLVQFYIFDIFRGWIGYFILALLGTRTLSDLEIILLSIPFAFLLYPLSLPGDIWLTFLTTNMFASGVLGNGLSYGSLNTNTLGQAAATASVVAAGMGYLSTSGGTKRRMLALFCIGAAIVFMTSARQALLGLLVGVLTIGATSGMRRGIRWLVVLGVVLLFGSLILFSALPQGSGLAERLIELTRSPDQWESQSFTIRANEYGEAFQSWLDSPFIGHGFGGQRFNDVQVFDAFGMDEAGVASFALSGTHNLPLGILAQTGIMGFLLFAILCWGIIRSFLSSLDRTNPLSPADRLALRVTCLSAFAAIFVMQNISGGMGVSSAALVFLLGAMLSFTASTNISSEQETKRLVGVKHLSQI